MLSNINLKNLMEFKILGKCLQIVHQNVQNTTLVIVVLLYIHIFSFSYQTRRITSTVCWILQTQVTRCCLLAAFDWDMSQYFLHIQGLPQFKRRCVLPYYGTYLVKLCILHQVACTKTQVCHKTGEFIVESAHVGFVDQKLRSNIPTCWFSVRKIEPALMAKVGEDRKVAGEENWNHRKAHQLILR